METYFYLIYNLVEVYEMNWLELRIFTDEERFPSIENYLYSKDIYSFEIIDPNMADMEKQNETDWNFIDEEIFKDSYDGIELKLYKSEESQMDFQEIVDFVEENGLGTIATGTVEEKDWSENWKKYYHVQKIGERVVIKPTWEEYDAKEGDVVIELDPGMAFGTGDHETTSMCIAEMEKYVQSGDRIFDIGCGSGILSIAGEKFGGGEVIGVDLDPMCIVVSKENAQLNNCVATEFLEGDLFSVVDGKADLIVSNIIAEVIVGFVGDLGNYLEDDGKIILSGIIREKEQMVVDELEKNDYNIISIGRKGEWVSITADKR